MTLRLLPRFSEDPDRDWVIWLLAAACGTAASTALGAALGGVVAASLFAPE